MNQQVTTSTAASVTVQGRVQGVGFRYFVFKHARRQGLKGWVRNTSDGNVEAYFEGEKEHIDSLVDLCKTGPVGAIVKDIEVDWVEPTGSRNDFDFKYD